MFQNHKLLSKHIQRWKHILLLTARSSIFKPLTICSSVPSWRTRRMPASRTTWSLKASPEDGTLRTGKTQSESLFSFENNLSINGHGLTHWWRDFLIRITRMECMRVFWETRMDMNCSWIWETRMDMNCSWIISWIYFYATDLTDKTDSASTPLSS